MEPWASDAAARAVHLAEARLADVKQRVDKLHHFYDTASKKAIRQGDRLHGSLWSAQMAAIEEVQRIIGAVENDNGIYVVPVVEMPVSRARVSNPGPTDIDTRCPSWALKGYQHVRCEAERGHESREIDPGRPHFNGWHRWSPQEAVVPPEAAESV